MSLTTSVGSSGSRVLLQGSHTVIGVHKGVERREENKTTREIDSNNQAVFLNNTEWNNVNQMDKTLCKASERADHERRSGIFILNEKHDRLCELQWS
jgi:hypothetical protein